LEPELLALLPEDFTIEVSSRAQEWWGDAARSLRVGKLVTFDYGLNADELLSPARTEGTLRAFRQHRLVRDVLANPGEQDITAHVNFTAIRSVGEAAGLQTETYCPQAKFLTEIVARACEPQSAFGPWTTSHTKQFQTMTHPDHLGRNFRVLVQSTRPERATA
jgi:SAM-dependent MidA family methyltransferase